MANSAMMGAAYRAKHGLYKNKSKFYDIVSSLPEPQQACRPYDDAENVNIINFLILFSLFIILCFRFTNQWLKDTGKL